MIIKNGALNFFVILFLCVTVSTYYGIGCGFHWLIKGDNYDTNSLSSWAIVLAWPAILLGLLFVIAFVVGTAVCIWIFISSMWNKYITVPRIQKANLRTAAYNRETEYISKLLKTGASYQTLKTLTITYSDNAYSCTMPNKPVKLLPIMQLASDTVFWFTYEDEPLKKFSISRKDVIENLVIIEPSKIRAYHPPSPVK